MRIEDDCCARFRVRLFDCRRQCCFSLILNGLINRQNDRLTGAAGNLSALVCSAARILLNEEFARLACDLLVVDLLNSP
jgi:hypothetical protein